MICHKTPVTRELFQQDSWGQTRGALLYANLNWGRSQKGQELKDKLF